MHEEFSPFQRWGMMVDPDEPIEAGDRLVFAATEDGITAIWRKPLFGMSAQRLYAISVSAGEPASLYDFERNGSLRVIAARSDCSLHETDLNLEPRVLGLLAGSIGLGAIVFESGLADVIADLSTGSLALVIVLALATTDHSPGRLSRLVPSAPTFRASSEAATAWLATLLTICGR